MSHVIDTILEPALWFAVEWSLRWAALLTVTAFVLWIFQPRRATIREWVFKATVLAGLLIPLSPRWGEGWQWHQVPKQSPPASFPRSAWERTSGRSAYRPAQEPDATQSVAPVRSHAERGYEGAAQSESLGSRRLIVLGLVSCWSFVVAYQLIRCLCGWYYLRRLRGQSIEATGAAADLFTACRVEMRVRNGVRLATHPHIRSPILLGWLRPQILVPPNWPQRSVESQRAGLLHELAHVRRRDHLLAPLLQIVRIVFFFHPLVRWLLARLEREREWLCDEMVVWFGIDRREYARQLLEFARLSGRLAWSAVSLPMSQQRTVKGRIYHLLEEDMERWIRPLPARWAVALGIGLLAVSLGLASYRVWAEEKKKPAPHANKPDPQPAVKKPAEPIIKREDLRYADKDFYRWRRDLLTELKPSIRADGMSALGAFGVHGYGVEATQAILEMMRGYDPNHEYSGSEDTPVVQSAYSAIEKIGAAGVPTLAAAVKEENRNVRLFAVRALAKMGNNAKPALPDLLRAFKNQDLETREWAINSVGRIGQGNKRAIAAVIEELNDPNAAIRTAAVWSLNMLDKPARPAVPAFLRALSDKDASVRNASIQALINALLEVGAELKPEDVKEAVPALITSLKIPESRLKAICLLEKIGPAAREAIPALSELLRTEDERLRKSVVDTLKAISPDNKRLPR